MQPIQWAQTIIDHAERQGIVGAILPQGAADASDRYQPWRVYATYGWSGDRSADTTISFKTKAVTERPLLDLHEDGWAVSSRIAGGSWGEDWEEITITRIGGSPETIVREFHAPDRFRVRVSLRDEPLAAGFSTREIVIENLREVGGMLHALRINQSNLPALHEIRPYGIDEDIYYRAGGLIGTLSPDGKELLFSPWALLPEPIRRPKMGPSLEIARSDGLIAQTLSLLQQRGIQHLYQFQADSINEIRQRLSAGPKEAGLLLTGGTAAGKTEAFLMPLLEELAEDSFNPGVKGLFVYPMKALAADQARRFFWYLATFNRGRKYPISIGILDADTPFDRNALAEAESHRELRTPFSECPEQECGEQLMFTVDRNGVTLTAPTCSACGMTFPWLRLHRRDIQDSWPHLLLTNPDMFHRQISGTFAWSWHSVLGRHVHACETCGRFKSATHKSLSGKVPECACHRPLSDAVSVCPPLIVFDESHLYKGVFGSQVAMLIARIRRIANQYGHRPTFIGVSATVASPQQFGMQLFGGSVIVIQGQEEELADEPTRYHLFLMPIQVTVLNAVGHVLAGSFVADHEAGELNRVLVFSDSKRTVYQLEASLPEFYTSLPGSVLPRDWPTPTTRSHTGDHSPEERRRVEIAFDQCNLRVLLATQTLEVGIDFRNLQLEIQTGATYSYNDYIQRVGRAGRQGVPALVVCILRPQVPLDYYYFEHCRELVKFSEATLDEVPLRTDNPFLIERHVPATVQDYLTSAEEGARLTWFQRDAAKRLQENEEEALKYLRDVFIAPHSEDADLINDAIDRGLSRAVAALTSPTASGNTADRLAEVIQLTVRSTDAPVTIESDDFATHGNISLSGEIGGEIEEEIELPVTEDEVDSL